MEDKGEEGEDGGTLDRIQEGGGWGKKRPPGPEISADTIDAAVVVAVAVDATVAVCCLC